MKRRAALSFCTSIAVLALASFGMRAAAQSVGVGASIPSVCGNGVVDAGEQCDGGNLGGQTCASQGFGGGTLSCNPDCTLNTTQCTPAIHGGGGGGGGGSSPSIQVGGGGTGYSASSIFPTILRAADFDHDGNVDIVDLSILLYYYHRTDTIALQYDLNRDGIVDFPDISILMYYWTD